LLQSAKVNIFGESEEIVQPCQAWQKVSDQVVVCHVIAVQLQPLHVVWTNL